MAAGTIAGVELPAYRVNDTGGTDTPTQRVDRDFDWSSFNQRQPVEVTVDAVVKKDAIGQLRDLRESQEPFGASLGDIELSNAILTNLNVEQSAGERTHDRVTVELKEVFTANLETTEVTIETPSGTQSGDGGGEEGSSGQRPPIVGTDSDDTGSTAPSGEDRLTSEERKMMNGTAGLDEDEGDSSGGFGNMVDNAVSKVTGLF